MALFLLNSKIKYFRHFLIRKCGTLLNNFHLISCTLLNENVLYFMNGSNFEKYCFHLSFSIEEIVVGNEEKVGVKMFSKCYHILLNIIKKYLYVLVWAILRRLSQQCFYMSTSPSQYRFFFISASLLLLVFH